jgi:NAD(P)-dependent dehydrogenase (short-subunit alcohol dehydrogenase family)
MKKNWSAQDIPAQGGKWAIVTGANSGIGYYTALELARAGAEVTLAVRDVTRGEEAKQRMSAEVPGAKIAVEALDLSSLTSVRAFSDRAAARKRPLDLLVNNAGIMALPTRELTVDGFEKQFGTNHLGHFALTGLVLPLLLASTKGPRVLTVSSSVTLWARIDLANLQSEKRYVPMATYGQSKLANLLFMRELQHRYGPAGLLSVASHPGGSITNLQKHAFKRFVQWFGQTADQGALPSLYGATETDVRGGTYFGPRSWFGMRGAPHVAYIPARGRNDELARALWVTSEALTGVVYPTAPIEAKRAPRKQTSSSAST